LPNPSSDILMFTENRRNIPEVENFRVRNEIILLLGMGMEGGPLVKRTLEAVGYPVLTADNRQQADELFRSFDGAIRLLIIEIVEKESSQLELITDLRKANPTLKVIVASEEISPRERHDIYISGVIEPIRKPVDKQQLLEAVRRTVEK
jgi:DNA-binding NtrC family response regulator